MDRSVVVALLAGALYAAVVTYGVATTASRHLGTGEAVHVGALAVLVAFVAAVPVFLLLRYGLVAPFLLGLVPQVAAAYEVLYGYTVEPSIGLYLSPFLQLPILLVLAVVAAVEFAVRSHFESFPPSPVF